MPTLTIDNQQIEVAPGATILDAARALGMDIPTLCHLPGREARPSCFLCVVRVEGMARLVPSCGTKVTDGMTVFSECDEVQSARRTVIELLLSDHLGDCIGPCRSTCPAHMDMPRMTRLIAEGCFRDALILVKEDIALPATLGRICPEICESACRRAHADGAVSVCLLKRFVADEDLASPEPYLPPCEAPSGKSVAIIGSGPAGLSAAYYLQQCGHQCVLFDEHVKPGGMLRYGVPEGKLPREVLDAEITLIEKLGARFQMNTRIGRDISLAELQRNLDAVLLTIGDIRENEIPDAALEKAGHGLRADKNTLQTNLPGVFVAGSAHTPSHHAIRACAGGKEAAQAIDRFLCGETARRKAKSWSIHAGRLNPEEVAPYEAIANMEPRHTPAGNGFTFEEAIAEASRCLHCDCRGADSCVLRDIAGRLNAKPAHFKSERLPFRVDDSHPEVIFEAGKCIACGICVRIAAEAGENWGWNGRGLALRPAPPLEMPLREAMRRCARECAAACPTAALVVRDGAGQTHEK